ncbi:MAG: sulfite exporter TauE/SafE family protein [Cyanobacteria bacterium J06627_15]
MTDWLLITVLGFLGSFGHCAGMCGPLAVALSGQTRSARQLLWFHLSLNLGRVLSYTLVGAAMGGLGSVIVAGGTLVGVGSPLRRMVTIVAGILLIWLGIAQLLQLPKLPLGQLFQTRLQTRLHAQLNWAVQSSQGVLVGLVWGLIPCGFLYTAQIKAAEASSLLGGATIMLAFGLGTLPIMVAAGVSARLLAPTHRQALYQMGGWLTLIIGLLTLTRTGEMPLALTGYGALACLMLALIARPISALWAAPLQARRALGLGAFILSAIHTLQMLDHSWSWQWRAFKFMLPQSQWGIALGGVALVLMLPAALTSFNRAQRRLKQRWRQIHLLGVPALILGVGHCVLTGGQYLGRTQPTSANWLAVGSLAGLMGLVLAVRSRILWQYLGLAHRYTPAQSSASTEMARTQL